MGVGREGVADGREIGDCAGGFDKGDDIDLGEVGGAVMLKEVGDEVQV